MKPVLVELRQTSLLDVAAKLRELADEVEANGARTVVVTIGDVDGSVSVRSYGEQSDPLSTAGWLARALTWTTQDCGRVDDVGISPDPAA